MDYEQSLTNIKNAMNFVSLFDQDFDIIFDFKDNQNFTVFAKKEKYEKFMFGKYNAKIPYASIYIDIITKRPIFYYYDINCTYEFDLYTNALVFFDTNEQFKTSDLLSIQRQFAKLLQLLQK